MKIRSDFVTNSSSSSFIAVFGTAKDNDIALNSAKENKLDCYTLYGKELIEQYKQLHREYTCDDWCWVDPFPSKDKIDENKLYFIYSDCTDVMTDEDGYILEDELEDHSNSVSSMLDKLNGFDFEIEQGSGRNG
jgi:hypothetical protein